MSDWFFVKENHAGVRTWMRVDDEGVVHVRKTQRVAPTLDLNTKQANEWTGWRGKDDAIVARVPTTVLWDWAEKGKIDAKLEDEKHLNRILNDSDFRKFRTGGGHL